MTLKNCPQMIVSSEENVCRDKINWSSPLMTLKKCERVLFSILKFFKKLAKTSVATKNVPLIRHLGFAERERDLLIAYFSSFFPHKIR